MGVPTPVGMNLPVRGPMPAIEVPHARGDEPVQLLTRYGQVQAGSPHAPWGNRERLLLRVTLRVGSHARGMNRCAWRDKLFGSPHARGRNQLHSPTDLACSSPPRPWDEPKQMEHAGVIVGVLPRPWDEPSVVIWCWSFPRSPTPVGDENVFIDVAQ